MNKLATYKVVTVTHKTSNLKKIGDFVIQDDRTSLKEKLERIKLQFGLKELMYLSTCNRVTYVMSSPKKMNKSFVRQFFSFINPNLSSEELRKRAATEVRTYEGITAIQHIFEVAASIDSLVVGEREILRQLREAFDQCQKWKLTGDDIRLLMRFVVNGAKEVYAKTRIGEKPISVVSLAIQKLSAAKRPRRSRILLVGAGQTNTLVSKFLAKQGYNHIYVFNRTLEKAQKLADRFSHGKALELDQLEHHKEGFDIMIVCTGATSPIVTPELYNKLLVGEDNYKIVIDLSVPNNVDYRIAEEHKVNYIEIEDLRTLADQNLAFREREVSSAKKLLMKHIEDYKGHYEQRQMEVALREIPTKMKEVKHRAFDVFKKDLAKLDDEALELVKQMMNYMEKKCISIPMTVAKKAIVGKK